MKIIFVLDDQTVLVSSPEDLQLRQLQPGLTGLVIKVGKNEQDEDLVSTLITYPVNLFLPEAKTEEVKNG